MKKEKYRDIKDGKRKSEEDDSQKKKKTKTDG